MKSFITMLLALLVSTGNACASAAEKADIWIDVRTQAEYLLGHKEGAIRISHSDIAGEIAKVTLDKNARIHLYCYSGGRAGKAKQILEGMGYTNVINEGGLADVRQRLDKDQQ